jgi:hypothetical protein
LKDGWRAAAAAYRLAYGEPSPPGRGNAHEAFQAATAALKELLPDLSDHDAMLEAVAAVHYASVVAPKWLYALHKPKPRR